MTREQWAKLSNKEKRVKIARLCGWTLDKTRAESDGHHPWLHPLYDPNNPLIFYVVWKEADLPDYLNDLNAMHKAEKLLINHECQWEGYISIEKYVSLLESICGQRVIAFATAAQRAEAFVLTMEGDSQ